MPQRLHTQKVRELEYSHTNPSVMGGGLLGTSGLLEGWASELWWLENAPRERYK